VLPDFALERKCLVNIVQAVPWYYPEGGGGTEGYVSTLCQKIREAGHEVCVAAPDPRDSKPKTYWHDEIEVFRYPTPKEPTRRECQARELVRGAQLFHLWLEKRRPAIVHFHTFGTGLGLREIRAAKAAGAHVFVTTHSASLGFLCQRGTMMQWGEHLCDGICQADKCSACELQHRGLSRQVAAMITSLPPVISALGGSFPGKLGTVLGMKDLISFNRHQQAEMFEMVDNFIVLTAWAYEKVIATGAPIEQVLLNRLGVSALPEIRKPCPEQRPTRSPILVGYLGRFDGIKGVEDFARAIASIPREMPIRFEFRGPVNCAAERQVVSGLKRMLREDPRVNFAPAVPPEAMYDVLATYDALCCPSVCVEGGPTVALEAHAVGTPVIGTRIPGLSEIVSDGLNGRLVTPRDWQALAEILIQVALNPCSTIDKWRRFIPRPRVIADVASAYLELYPQPPVSSITNGAISSFIPLVDLSQESERTA
jgi:glycosyltransferase involved in cell wall biosynthesis